MSVHESLTNLPAHLKGAVIAIGNFDGVHRGHRALIAEARKMADAKGIRLGILTFEPHPRKLFRPDDPPFRITSPALKQKMILEAGADFVVSLPFDWDFASQSAEDFVANILAGALAPAHVVIGEDFRFGQLRKGSADTIRAAGLPATLIAPVASGGGRTYSSSDVRSHLRAGMIEEANGILGWSWEVEGRIFRGDRRGHALGYPTANILLGDILHPAYGIYATYVMIEGETEWRPAATNIGIRPMFELREGQIEAHILNMEDRDIYDRTLRVRPVRRLRGEAKFASLDDLVKQMEEDCAQVRAILT